MPTTAELPKRFKTINGVQMAYVDGGLQTPQAPVLWFQHGNPTSSFLWRDVIGELTDVARCIAPDLIGMGDSDKLEENGPGSYRFTDHFDYLNALMDEILPEGPVVLVLHDWGGGLGFHWAQRNPGRVSGIVYMETIVQPVTWADWPANAQKIFQAMRSEAGEDIVLEKNTFVERILPSSVLRELTPEEMAVYRRPFLLKGEDRRPTLTWPRELPIDGTPADMVELVTAYGQFMRQSDMPKLFINADPGSILVGKQRDFCRSWPNQEEVTVPGTHFIQEDSGAEIGRITKTWLAARDII